MWKKILIKLLKSLLTYLLNMLYNFIDKDKDGKLDKEEIESIVNLIRSQASKLKKKVRC